jgi:hypothetical protein
LKSVDAPEALAAHSGAPFKVLDDPVEPALLTAAGAPDVIAVVIGARAMPAGHRPVGHTARHIPGDVQEPVAVVPFEMVSPRLIRRLLVPLEGTEVSSRTVLERMLPPLVADVALVVIHVFTDTTLPACWITPGATSKPWEKSSSPATFLMRVTSSSERVRLPLGYPRCPTSTTSTSSS